jgi:hypothetical protein
MSCSFLVVTLSIFSLVLPVPGVELVSGLYELFLLGGDLEFQPLLVRLRLLQPLLQARDLQSKKLCFLYIFGGLECVGNVYAYVVHLVFLGAVWNRIKRIAVANRRATNTVTHLS